MAIKKFSELLRENFRRQKYRRSSDIEIGIEKRNNDKRKVTESIDYVARMPEVYSHQGRVGGGEEFAVLLYGFDEFGTIDLIRKFLDKVRSI